MKAHLYISGRVQGVFYRAHTKKQAERLGLSGWVRNLADGRVEAVFQGQRSKVEAMIDWCRQGSPASQVEEVEVAEKTFADQSVKTQEKPGFEIRY